MPDSSDPPPPEVPNELDERSADDAAHDDSVEESDTRALVNIWRRLPGRFPGLTFLILLLSAVVFAVGNLVSEQFYEIFYATGYGIWAERRWWALIGTVFLHKDILHLLFNAYWFWIFGRLIERELGLARYLGLFLAGAWIGSAAEFAWSGDLGIGLSGVVYAYFGFLLINRRQHPDFAAVLPMGTVQLLIAWLVLCFPLTYLGVLRVANLAHLGGLVAGGVVGGMSDSHFWRGRARWAALLLVVLSIVPLVWAPWQEKWLVLRAYQTLVSNAGDAAGLEALEKVRAKNPDNEWMLENEAIIRERQGRYADARQALERALEHSDKAQLRNFLAWLLATCPDATVRDGARAIVLARRACESDGWKTAAYIDTLAAAYAETGDFKEAENWMLKALEKSTGKEPDALRQHLESFRAGKPWREPAVEKVP